MKDLENWFIQRNQNSPVLCTAVHAGHHINKDLLSHCQLPRVDRLREEDPLTNLFILNKENFFFSLTSRFEVDLNRPKEQAFYRDPEDAWGLDIWKKLPSDELISRSLEKHRLFYQGMKDWIEELIDKFGKIIVLDVHSYNHRRDGANKKPADSTLNPDIDLGITTADEAIFGDLISAIEKSLKTSKLKGNEPSVGKNIRFPDGGEWPEWIYRNYPKDVCTITLEYKKFYIDEWSGMADMEFVNDIRKGICSAIEEAKEILT